MVFQKDLFSNILYSVLLSTIMLINSSHIPTLGTEIIPVLKNFLMVALLAMWLKTLSHNKRGDIVLLSINSNKKSVFRLGFTLIINFIGIKLLIFLMIFLTIFFIDNQLIVSRLYEYVIQLFSVCLYTLSILLIGISYFRLSVDSWKFIVVLTAPYFSLFIIFAIFNLDNFLYFTLIPANFNMIFIFNTDVIMNNIIALSISMAIFITMFTSIFISIAKIKKKLNY